jgi:hypothetical protein
MFQGKHNFCSFPVSVLSEKAKCDMRQGELRLSENREAKNDTEKMMKMIMEM